MDDEIFTFLPEPQTPPGVYNDLLTLIYSHEAVAQDNKIKLALRRCIKKELEYVAVVMERDIAIIKAEANKLKTKPASVMRIK